MTCAAPFASGSPVNWHLSSGRATVAGPVAIVDLDGVLADALHRQHFLHLAEPDWAGFYAAVDDDGVLAAGMRLLDTLRESLPIVILTGRTDEVARTTLNWLDRHRIRWDMLICRPPDDDDASTHAVDYKRVEVHRMLEAGLDPVLAVDDNRKIVEMYEEFGIPSIYVSSGYYEHSARYDGGV